MIFVPLPGTTEDGFGLIERWLVDHDLSSLSVRENGAYMQNLPYLSKSSSECAIFFNMLPILCKRGGTYAPELATGELRFQ